MLITRPVFLVRNCNDPRTSFLRYSNVVGEENKNSAVVLHYPSPETLEDLIKKYIGDNKEREVIIDNTCELINSPVVKLLSQLSIQYNISLYFNDVHTSDDIKKLEDSNITLIKKYFFVEYYHYYIPRFGDTSPIKQSNITADFLFLSGKPKLERAIFVYKLFQKQIENNGIISYFGVEENTDFVKGYLDFRGSPLYKKYYKKIIDFNNSLPHNLNADIAEFNYNVSHTRFFNADLYTIVDFVVVFESDFYAESFFPTEKPIKPILLNKKFIYLGKKGCLVHLKKLMLEIHNRDISELTDWIDTKYDEIDDIEEKIDFVIDNMKKYIQRQT